MDKKRRTPHDVLLVKYPRSESNRDQRNRNPLFYPLNYRGIPFRECKFSYFLLKNEFSGRRFIICGFGGKWLYLYGYIRIITE